MNTDMTWQTRSTSTEATEQLGAQLGSKLRGGEVIELISDLGGGKTTFTRGIVRGARSSDVVGSPTFTISRRYSAPDFTIAHFDFYRLTEPGIVAEELAEMLCDPSIVIIIEWGEIVADVLPEDRITITITQTPEGDRQLEYQYRETKNYLFDKSNIA